jgi:uncharacterized LabA/DUF88 family protein
MADDEERIALFLDFENLAIGARDAGISFDFGPIADALAERGRVIVRRAYADWIQWQEEGRALAHRNVELIEIPQRMGAARKNAADIKMAVDAVELCLERAYVSTFVVATGDSDFTPLVQKLRELNRRVIGIGVKASTSPLLPPACDEFLFYESIEGVEAAPVHPRPSRGPRRIASEVLAQVSPGIPEADEARLTTLITQTLAGLKRSGDGAVYASALKRAILRKDPTFSEADFGFRAFGELLGYLAGRTVIALSEGIAKGDPEVDFSLGESGEEQAFTMLQTVVHEIQDRKDTAQLSGLKNEMRKREPEFSEKQFGFGGFLQFCKAAKTRGYIDMDWDDDVGDYVLHVDKGAIVGT